MTLRPQVIDLLNDLDPVQPATHADGSDLTAPELDLIVDATPAERAAAAQARLLARSEAAQAIRAHLVDSLTTSGVSAQHAARFSDGLVVHLGNVPHSEVVKVLGAPPAAATPDEMRTRFGRGWTALVANEAALPAATVSEVYEQVARG